MEVITMKNGGRQRLKHHDDQGFTLLEILAVVVIMGILATLVGPSVFRRLAESRQVTSKDQIELFATALEHYRLDNGQYPSTEQGLNALWQQPTLPPVPANWNGPYTMKAPPQDPWGKDYVYRAPGERNTGGYDLFSLGSDGQQGGEGEARDITNW
jgi:general secretion pathway protein G